MEKNFMAVLNKSLSAILVVSIGLCAGCKEMKEDISDLKNRVDNIENVRLNTVSGQIKAINESLPKLEQTDKELKGYIESLEKTSKDLRKSIDDADVKIEEVSKRLDKAIEDAAASEGSMKEEFSKSVSDAKADVLAQLSAMKTELEGRLSRTEETVGMLKAKDEEIEQKISELKTYVNGEIQSSKDWASATFATLEQYEGITSDIASIRSAIESLEHSLEMTEEKLSRAWKTDIEAAVAPVRESVGGKVSEITEAYKKAISDAASATETAYKEAIADAIANRRSH